LFAISEVHGLGDVIELAVNDRKVRVVHGFGQLPEDGHRALIHRRDDSGLYRLLDCVIRGMPYLSHGPPVCVIVRRFCNGAAFV